jgi:hypothetical protein
MHVLNEFDYRNAKAILDARVPGLLDEVLGILNNAENRLDVNPHGKQRDVSRQIQRFFEAEEWRREVSHFSVPDLKYDLLKSGIPIEIEIGHERLVYAVFFKFLVDYSNQQIPTGIVVATENPEDFGESWHNSRLKTQRKIEALSKFFLVPVLVIGISP